MNYLIFLISIFEVVASTSSPASFEEAGDFHHLVSDAHFGLVINFTEYGKRLDVLDKYITSSVQDSDVVMVRSVFSRLHAVLRATRSKLQHYKDVFAVGVDDNRGKRDLSSVLSLGLSCLSLFTDWQMSSTMDEIKSRQNLFASQLVSLTNSTVKTGKDIRKLKGAVDMIASRQTDLRELSSLESVFLSIDNESNNLFGGLDVLLSGRLSPRLLHGADVDQKFRKLVSSVASAKYRLIFPQLQQLFQLQASHYSHGDCLFVLVQVPMEPIGAPSMSLFKHSEVPVYVHDELVVVKGKSSFLAISKDNSKFVDISDSELRKCRVVGRKYLCSYPGVELSTGVQHCLKDIFLSTLQDAVSNCHVSVLRKELFLARVNSTSFAAFAPVPTAGTLSCGDTIQPLMISGYVVRDLSPGCFFTLRGWNFRAAFNPVVAPVRVSSVIFHDAINFSRVYKNDVAIEEALKGFQEIDLQSLAQGGEKIADLDPWEDSGLSAVWITIIVLSVIVLLLLITLVIVFKCRHVIFASMSSKSQQCQEMQLSKIKDHLAEEEALIDMRARMESSANAPPSPSVSTLVRHRSQKVESDNCLRKQSEERQPMFNPYEYV